MQKLKILIAVYLITSGLLILSVISMPLMIKHDFTLSRDIIIREEIVETALIVILLAISYLTFKAFKHALKAYEQLIDRATENSTRLVSRLSEAFSYIGTVNVEIKEINAIVCGVDTYPRTKREFRKLVNQLAAKAMAIANTPWAVLRIIEPGTARTLKECAVEGRKGALPSNTTGNRAIVEGRLGEGLRAIGKPKKDPAIMTVCILPSVSLSEEAKIMITAILNQVEMLFMLHSSGCLRQTFCSKIPKYKNNDDLRGPDPSIRLKTDYRT